MITPSRISVVPNVLSIVVPEYNFENQSRGTLIASKYTAASLQTFDSKGQPKDSKSDNND